MMTSSFVTFRRLGFLLLLGSVLTACALEFPITRGEELALEGRWEEAVQFFREAVREDPRNLDARLGLARSMLQASQSLVAQGQELERADQLERADLVYRRALSYSAENRLALVQLAAHAGELGTLTGE